MVAFGILNWYYCDSGNWLTVSATDYHALEILAEEIGKHVMNQAEVKLVKLISGGGTLRIQNCIFHVADEKIENQMDTILETCGWRQDFNPYNYKKFR